MNNFMYSANIHFLNHILLFMLLINIINYFNVLYFEFKLIRQLIGFYYTHASIHTALFTTRIKSKKIDRSVF